MIAGGEDDSPLNILPIAPSLEKALVPAPWVFSPAAGCSYVNGEEDGRRGRMAYNLVDRLVDTAAHISLLDCGVGALLKGLCCIVTVHFI